MNRRSFLATAGAALLGTLAGCAHPEGTLSMDPVADDDDLAAEYATPADHLADDYRAIFDAALAGENVTREDTSPPLDLDRPVAHEGRYYAVTHEVVGTRTATQYTIEVDYDPAPSAVDGDAMAFEDLPAVDRAALEGLIPPPDDGVDRDGTVDGFRPDRGTSFRPPADADSTLVPQPDYEAIVHEGDRYGVRVGDSRSVTVQTYRYRTEQVADGPAALAADLRTEYLFELGDLPDDEREIVESAIGDTYYVDGAPSDAFESLADRFFAHDGIGVGEFGGNWIVRYDGQVYWAGLDGQFGDRAGSPTPTADGSPGRSRSASERPGDDGGRSQTI